MIKDLNHRAPLEDTKTRPFSSQNKGPIWILGKYSISMDPPFSA